MELEVSLLDLQQKSESAQPAIEVIGLSKVYSWRDRKLVPSARGFLSSILVGQARQTVALDNVSFSVGHGEVFGLLGPNGSGKTTIIKILANLVIPESGKVVVDGINVSKNPYLAAARLQTVLSESIGLEKRISARDNLLLFASLYNLPSKEAVERTDKLLEFFGLTEVADKTSQSFSTGMSRKLSVARVLLSNASVVVFDEPTSGLDPGAADSFRRLIIDDLVKREGKTVLIATHNLPEASFMCNKIALLNKGRLLAIGSPDEVSRAVADRVHLGITLDGAKSSLDILLPELRQVGGVLSAETNDNKGVREVVVTGRKDMDYSSVFGVISARGFKVLSLETSSPTLEDAFLRLVREAKR